MMKMEAKKQKAQNKNLSRTKSTWKLNKPLPKNDIEVDSLKEKQKTSQKQ